MIPEPEAVAVEDDIPKIEVTEYSICIPTIEGRTFLATSIAVFNTAKAPAKRFINAGRTSSIVH